jgi:hypothetical protein
MSMSPVSSRRGAGRTSSDRSAREAQSPVRVIFLFTTLTAAAVVLTLIAAYWGHDGAAALGYLGGGMFGAALTFLLLTSAQWERSSRPQR